MARKYTPFNGPGGESVTTDAERMQFADAQRQASIAALRQGMQPQEAAQPAGYQYNPAEFNDWQNRQREVRQNNQAILGTAGDQERQNILTRDVGQNYRTDATMRPSTMGAEDARSLQMEGKGFRDMRNARKEDIMRNWGASGALGGGMTPEQMDQRFMEMQFLKDGGEISDPRARERQGRIDELNISKLNREDAMSEMAAAQQAGNRAAMEEIARTRNVPMPQMQIDPDQAGAQLGTDVAAWGKGGDADAPRTKEDTLRSFMGLLGPGALSSIPELYGDAKSSLGFGPKAAGEPDLERFLQQAQRAEEAYIQKGAAPEVAAREVDQLIRRQATAGKNSTWINELLRRLQAQRLQRQQSQGSTIETAANPYDVFGYGAQGR